MHDDTTKIDAARLTTAGAIAIAIQTNPAQLPKRGGAKEHRRTESLLTLGV